MQPTPAEEVRRLIARPFGLIDGLTVSATTTSATLTSNDLSAEYPEDDVLNGQYVMWGDNFRRITGYDGSLGRLSLGGRAVSTVSGQTFDVLAINPRIILRSYNRAARDVFRDKIGLIRDDQDSLVTGIRQHVYELPPNIRELTSVYIGGRLDVQRLRANLLDNPGFELWSSDFPDDWTKPVLPAGAEFREIEAMPGGENEYFVVGGRRSLAYEQATTTRGSQWKVVQNVDLVTGSPYITVSAWVYRWRLGNAPNGLGLIVGDKKVSIDTEYDKWEYVTAEIDATTNTDTTAFEVGFGDIVGASGRWGFVIDDMIALEGPQSPADVAWTPVVGYNHVPETDGGSGYGQLHFHKTPPSKHRLRLVGRDQLPTLGRWAGQSVPIDGDVLSAVIFKAQQYVAEDMVVMMRRVPDYVSLWQGEVEKYAALYREAVPAAVQKLPIMDLRNRRSRTGFNLTDYAQWPSRWSRGYIVSSH